MKIFSLQYEIHISKMNACMKLLDNNPSIEVYKDYNRLKSKVWAPEERFTKEYLEQFSLDKQTSNESFEDQCEWLYQSLMIDVKFERNQITDNQKVIAHKNNNLKFNLK